MTAANAMLILKSWGGCAAAVIVRLKALAPYALIELVLPGGSVMALLLWLYRRRKNGVGLGRFTVKLLWLRQWADLLRSFRSSVSFESNSAIWPSRSSGSRLDAKRRHIPVDTIRAEPVLRPIIVSPLAWAALGSHPRRRVISEGCRSSPEIRKLAAERFTCAINLCFPSL